MSVSLERNLLIGLVFACLTAVPRAVLARDGTTFFGPEVFVRENGAPRTVTRAISTTGFAEPFVMHVRNGDSAGRACVSSATVSVNGRVVLTAADFSQGRRVYDLPLVDPSTLDVRLASAPGSKLTIWIDGRPQFSPVLEASQAQEQIIGRAGGALTAVSGNGATISLLIPELALTVPTAVRVTPLSAVDGMPWKGTFLGGVRLEPDGLEFSKPVVLAITPPAGVGHGKYAIGFAYRDDDRGAHLYPAWRDDGTLELSVVHFSGYGGVAIDNDADFEEARDLPASGDEDDYDKTLALILADAQARGEDPLSQATRDTLKQVFMLYYQAEGKPAMDAYIACLNSNCADWKELATNLLHPFERMTGWKLPPDVRSQFDDVIDEWFGEQLPPLLAMYGRWNDECAAASSCSLRWEEIRQIIALAVIIQQIGGDVDVLTVCGNLMQTGCDYTGTGSFSGTTVVTFSGAVCGDRSFAGYECTYTHTGTGNVSLARSTFSFDGTQLWAGGSSNCLLPEVNPTPFGFSLDVLWDVGQSEGAFAGVQQTAFWTFTVGGTASAGSTTGAFEITRFERRPFDCNGEHTFTTSISGSFSASAR